MTLQGDLLTGGKFLYSIFIVIYLILFTIWLIKRKTLLSHFVLLASAAYMDILFMILFLPLPLTEKGIQIIGVWHMGMPLFNIVPLQYITIFILQAIEFGEYKQMILNVIGNILCFVPFGFLLPCLFKKFFDKKRFLAAALIVPICVELTQLILSLIFNIVYRFADIDDVLLNFTGGIIGYEILLFTVSFLKKHFKIDCMKLLYK
jgi:glycopeptide antibiotics resistance protein